MTNSQIMRILLIIPLIVAVQFQSLTQRIAFKTVEKDLFCEGIAHDSLSGKFFLSSMHKNKIVQIVNGKTTDFIKTNQYGFVGGVGLHVDNKRRILWACSGNIMGKYSRTGIFAFDLKTKKLLKKVFFAKDTSQRLFNDIAIAQNGDIYVTNTLNHSVWKWNLEMDKPIKLPILSEMKYANGITVSEDNKYLFVATNEGLKRINLSNNAYELLKMPTTEINAKGLDGITFFKNSIIGVQNDVKDNSLIKLNRYYLNEAFNEITKVEIIDTNNKYFDVATTFVIANNQLFLLANSQMDNLDQEKLSVKDKNKMKETIILKYEIY